ncbi:MAG: threonine ammonia-lyase [Planctomycetota bacterium]|jgi:threonine dehydratase
MFDLIEKVRGPVSRNTRRTPVVRSEWLSSLTGGDVFLKCENLQITGSFKVRGGFAAFVPPRPDAVVASSAGNHGLGLALAAKKCGAACTIVVPESIPKMKEEAIRGLGARIVKAPFHGYDETQAWAAERAEEFGGAWVSPFDDDRIIAGNGGTTALEIVEEVPDLDAIVIPCGGGGCAIGAGIVAEARSPKTRILGVNSDASPGMWMSFRDGKAHLKVESRPTIAEGIEGGVSKKSFALAKKHISDIIVVRETAIRRAVGEIARRERMVVEASGAAGVAAVVERKIDAKRVCVILTGSNIDMELFTSLLAER